MLSSVLILAAAEPEKGMVMILFYTLGFVIPFLLLGLFSETVLNLVKKHKGVMAFTVKAGSVLMIVLGLLLFTGKLDGVGTAAPQQDAAQNTQQDAAQNDKPTQNEQQTQNTTQGEQKDQTAVAAIGKDAVIVLGVAAPKLGGEKDEAGIKAFMDKNGYAYPVLMDKKGKLFEAYGIRAIPTTYLIDRDGNIIGRVQGALSAENIERIVQEVLAR